MPKLIALDLDGTLFRSDKSISSYTLETLRRCREAGHYVVIATGRTEKGCERIFPDISPDALILSDGTYARCGEEVLCQKFVSKATLSALLEWCNANPDVLDMTLDTPTGYKSTAMPNVPEEHMADFMRATTVVGAFSSLGADIEAYSLNVSTYKPEEMMAFAANFPDVRSHLYGWVCIWPANSGKWPALEIVAPRLGVDLKDIIAFGDEGNDLEMIEKAGIGVAMGNATDEVKAVSDYICGTNDNDGIARWLEEFLL